MTSDSKIYFLFAVTAIGLLSHSSCFGQDAAKLSVILQASSDWIYHGVSETNGEPTIGFNLDYQPLPHLFFGLEAHQGRVENLRQRQGSVMGYLGTGKTLFKNWYATLAIQHREFPGSTKEWDFTEFTNTFTHQSGFSTQVSYSPDYYEHDVEALHFQADYTHQTQSRWFWRVQAGATQFFSGGPGFVNYEHALVGIGTSVNRWNVTASYAWTSAGPDDDFGGAPIESPGLIVGFSYRVQ